MLTISLKNVRLHGKHGLYPQEAITGNEFEVNVTVFLSVDPLGEWPFVDYSHLHHIIVTVFATPTKLLETLVREIYGRIKDYVPMATKVSVAVRKLAPPIEGASIEAAEVCYED